MRVLRAGVFLAAGLTACTAWPARVDTYQSGYANLEVESGKLIGTVAGGAKAHVVLRDGMLTSRAYTRPGAKRRVGPL